MKSIGLIENFYNEIEYAELKFVSGNSNGDGRKRTLIKMVFPYRRLYYSIKNSKYEKIDDSILEDRFSDDLEDDDRNVSSFYDNNKNSDFGNCRFYMNDDKYVIPGRQILEDCGKTIREIRESRIKVFINEISMQRDKIIENTGNDWATWLKEALLTPLSDEIDNDLHKDRILKNILYSYIEKIYITCNSDGEELLTKMTLDYLCNALYYYFFYAVTDKIPVELAFSSAYPEYEHDLREYNAAVIGRYGNQSPQAVNSQNRSGTGSPVYCSGTDAGTVPENNHRSCWQYSR